MSEARLDQLKARYKDRSLSRSERQKILMEIRAEAYRTDTRKPISVRKMTRINGITALLGSLTFFALPLLDMARDNDVLAVIALLPAFLTLGFGFYWLVMTASYKPEPDDELAAQNRSKAGKTAFLCCFSVIYLAVSLFHLISGTNDITVHLNDSFFFFTGTLFLYYFFECFIFLSLDGGFRDEPDEEEDTEE